MVPDSGMMRLLKPLHLHFDSSASLKCKNVMLCNYNYQDIEKHEEVHSLNEVKTTLNIKVI